MAAAQVADAPARQVYVDTQVRYSFKRKRLFVDEIGIWWGDDSRQFGAITAYSHWITHKIAAGNHTYEYRIRLWAEGKKPITIVFTGKDEGLRRAYDSAIQALWQYSGRPRLENVIGRVSAGQEVELAEWTVSQTGAKRGRKSLTWDEPIELRPSNVFAGHEVYVTRETLTGSDVPVLGYYDSLLTSSRWLSAAAAAVSSQTIVEVWRDGRCFRQRLVGMRPVEPPAEFSAPAGAGTRVAYVLDPAHIGSALITTDIASLDVHGPDCSDTAGPGNVVIRDLRDPSHPTERH